MCYVHILNYCRLWKSDIIKKISSQITPFKMCRLICCLHLSFVQCCVINSFTGDRVFMNNWYRCHGYLGRQHNKPLKIGSDIWSRGTILSLTLDSTRFYNNKHSIEVHKLEEGIELLLQTRYGNINDLTIPIQFFIEKNVFLTTIWFA